MGHGRGVSTQGRRGAETGGRMGKMSEGGGEREIKLKSHGWETEGGGKREGKEEKKTGVGARPPSAERGKMTGNPGKAEISRDGMRRKNGPWSFGMILERFGIEGRGEGW